MDLIQKLAVLGWVGSLTRRCYPMHGIMTKLPVSWAEKTGRLCETDSVGQLSVDSLFGFFFHHLGCRARAILAEIHYTKCCFVFTHRSRTMDWAVSILVSGLMAVFAVPR